MNAFGTADAVVLIDDRHLALRCRLGGFPLQRLWIDGQQGGDITHHRLTARCATIDLLALGDRLGVGAAPRVATLAALALWQEGIDTFDDRVSLHLKTAGGKAQD